MSNYPDWVKQFKTKGTCVRKVGNQYYLYKHSSKRVPGFKNPQANDTYIGLITPDGIVKSESRKVPLSGVIVLEYGYTEALFAMCPAEWKKGLGPDWESVLLTMVKADSPLSHRLYKREIPALRKPRYLSAQADKFWSFFEEGTRESLDCLKTSFIVSFGNSRVLSVLTDEQKDLYDRYGIPCLKDGAGNEK